MKPKKSLGQHFLKDENIARKIVDSLTGNFSNILEIGSGKGVLTKYLINNKKLNPFFIETDSKSVDFLKNEFPGYKNRIIHADFLNYDINQLFTEPFAIIGNFPYNISSQILFKILKYKNNIPEVVCMIQKEVAERIASPPGNKKYGILSVLLQAYYKIEYLFTVSEKVFIPPPKVKSGVIRLNRNSTYQLDCDEILFFKVVKAGFNQRRKTLRNALKSFNFDNNESLTELLSKRAEQLGVDDFVRITNNISV